MSNPLDPRRKTDPHDFLAIDDLLDDDERAIKQTVRRYVEDRVLPEIAH
jgi:glutaryl-CoA dehydrogenase